MKKIISLIKTCMTDNMSLFKIKSKNKNKILLPIFLTIIVFIYIWSYANIIIEPLTKVHLEFVLLTLFVFLTFILTLIEGIYKANSLLFNCKDDNLLLSLPIKKSTVLFVRIFKFYVFELMYNSLFLMPAMLVYTRYVSVNITYYIISIIMLILLPIIPIVLSTIVGTFIGATSRKFKHKNFMQILLTAISLLLVLFISSNMDNILSSLAKNAKSINEIITKLYYPAGIYIKLITDFNIIDLLVFIVANISLLILTIFLLSKVYFKINSDLKKVKTTIKNNNYKIKVNKKIPSLIKKEMKKIINTPVFVTNTSFSLVLFVIACILLITKYNIIIDTIVTNIKELDANLIKQYIPLLLYGFICFSSLTSSLTSSMISLEGKSFNNLKSLPISPLTIIISKILTTLIIMLPFIFIGDLIVIIYYKFNIISVFLILLSSIILPLVSETLGIIINIKYPKMNAENDTEVVKQSMSSLVAVTLGMVLLGLSYYIIYKCLTYNMLPNLIILINLSIHILILIISIIYLNKKSVKEFNSINI